MEEKNQAYKKVDEEWKEAVRKERESLQEQGKFVPPQPDFKFFITTLALQASIFMGIIPNPATNKKEEDLSQAQLIIDTLGMLKEKTVNNLTPEEANLLDNILYELRMQYVAKISGKHET